MPKKQDNDLLIGFVLDQSGSMASVRDQTISGFNEFVDDQERQGKALKATTLMSLTVFSYSPAVRTIATPIGYIPRLNTSLYAPNGGTALYDAIGETIKGVEGLTLRPKKVLFVIQTDGQENASRSYTREQIFRTISQKREEGWGFLFLGADQDAYAASAQIGIAQGSTVAYDSHHTAHYFAASSASATAYRTGAVHAHDLASKIVVPDADKVTVTVEKKS